MTFVPFRDAYDIGDRFLVPRRRSSPVINVIRPMLCS